MRVYFIDEWNSSRWNGIGTFRDIIVPGLFARGVDIALISLNSDCRDHELAKSSGILEIHVPYLLGGWRVNTSEVTRLLKDNINVADPCVFIVNHSPCADFIDSLRSDFPLCKVMFVIHDQGWCQALRGDAELLREIILSDSVPPIVSDRTVKEVRKCCLKEYEIYRRADIVVTLCESARKVALDVYGVPEHKVAMVSNALPGDYAVSLPPRNEARRLLGLREDDRILVFVGRAEVHKGMAAILRFAGLLADCDLYCRCAVIGALRNIAKYEKFITPAASRLIFPGHLSARELRMWYAAADVGVLSSYTEQCSFAALEMMASPMDLVSSSGFGLSDMFDSSVAYMCDPRPVNDDTAYIGRLKEGVISVLSLSDEHKDQIRQTRRKLLADKYSISAMLDG